MTNEEAKNLILSIDRFSYVDMISLLGQDECRISYEGPEGIIIMLGDDFMSVASFGDWHSILPHIDAYCPLICVHDEGLRDYLMENEGIVLDRDSILNTVWGYSFDGENRTVDVHIRHLREKLGDEGLRIETVKGVGYRFRGHDE